MADEYECPYSNHYLTHPDEPCWGKVGIVDSIWVEGEGYFDLIACQGHQMFHSSLPHLNKYIQKDDPVWGEGKK